MSASDFHDITSGTTTGIPRYTAGSGYDLATGLGSPYADRVVQAQVSVNGAGQVGQAMVVSTASPTGILTLGTTAPTLNDSAVLAGGSNPTGTLTFTLLHAGTAVFTQTDPVAGNGTYTTAGFTLPATGTVTGTYTWTVSYSGDANNSGASDQGGAAEQVVVSPASPTVMTASGMPTALARSKAVAAVNPAGVAVSGPDTSLALLDAVYADDITRALLAQKNLWARTGESWL
jgi:hypothetical protein